MARATRGSVGPVTREPGIVVQDVVYAGLDALRAVIPLELCAYLHAVAGFGPQLYLRSPDLSTMDAGEAFDVFTALRDALDSAEGDDWPLEVAGYDALAIPTAGTASRGVCVVGRRDRPLTFPEQDTAGLLWRAMGSACHAVEAATRPMPERSALRVSVEAVDGVAKAEVVVPGESGIRRGNGEAPSPTTAVALAALDAAHPAFKLGEVVDGEVSGERVMLVLVRDDQNHGAVGAALCASDHLHAAASATLEAANRLRS
jgi:hypothetical protein